MAGLFRSLLIPMALLLFLSACALFQTSAAPAALTTQALSPAPEASATSEPPTTSAPTITPAALVVGIVIADYAIYRSPSGEQEDYMGSLRGGQSVKVLRQEKTGEVLWYLCEWSDNDLISQG